MNLRSPDARRAGSTLAVAVAFAVGPMSLPCSARAAPADVSPTLLAALAGLDATGQVSLARPADEDSVASPSSAEPTSSTGTAAPDSPAEPRSIPSRLGGMALNFGSDLWYVASSPARINRKGALWMAGIVAVTGLIYAYDEEITAGFHRSHEDPTYEAVMEFGDFIAPAGFMPNALLVEGTGALVGYAFRIEPLRRMTMEMIESHMIAGGLRNTSKLFLGRRREHEGKGAYFFEYNGGTSFPSGHASVVFEIATIVSHHADHPIVTGAAYSLAGVLGLQRVHATQHWPSDVVLSAVTGTLIARTVIHRNAERRGRDVPVIGLVPIPGGAALTARF